MPFAEERLNQILECAGKPDLHSIVSTARDYDGSDLLFNSDLTFPPRPTHAEWKEMSADEKERSSCSLQSAQDEIREFEFDCLRQLKIRWKRVTILTGDTCTDPLISAEEPVTTVILGLSSNNKYGRYLLGVKREQESGELSAVPVAYTDYRGLKDLIITPPDLKARDLISNA